MINFSKIFDLLGLNKGHERTVKAKKNIAASFVIKGWSVAISLILVPLTIGYLNPTKYGIWITLSSIVGWFGFFDIGLGNGLRNKFAEALANDNHELARTYVSTTYAVLSIIIAIVLLLFYVVNIFINWPIILNTGDDPGLQNELGVLALIVFSFFCLSFIFKLISTILIADQQSAKASLFDLYANVLALLFIIILTNLTRGSLVYIGTIFSGMPVFVFFVSSLWLFNGKYKYYKPSIKFVDFSKARDLFSLGLKFFFIQISVVLLYQTNNIIISQLYGPAEVTPYNIAFKYFNVIMMFFVIIITPFWSAFTEAWVKKEFDWIKLVMKKLFRIWGRMIIAGVLLFFISPLVYQIWIGNIVLIPVSISALVGLWVILNCWNGIFSHFLNGVGKINLQLYLGIGVAILNIPTAILLGKVLGIKGILISNLIFASIQAIIVYIQYSKLINRRAVGIWNN